MPAEFEPAEAYGVVDDVAAAEVQEKEAKAEIEAEIEAEVKNVGLSSRNGLGLGSARAGIESVRDFAPKQGEEDDSLEEEKGEVFSDEENQVIQEEEK